MIDDVWTHITINYSSQSRKSRSWYPQDIIKQRIGYINYFVCTYIYTLKDTWIYISSV